MDIVERLRGWDDDSRRNSTSLEKEASLLIESFRVQLTTLTAKLAEAEKDAARYRWLRDNARIGFELENDEPVATIVFSTKAHSLRNLGLAIDEAGED